MEPYQAWLLVVAVCTFLVTLGRPLFKALKDGGEFRGKVLEKLDQFERVFEEDARDRRVQTARINAINTTVVQHTEQIDSLDKRVTTLETSKV